MTQPKTYYPAIAELDAQNPAMRVRQRELSFTVQTFLLMMYFRQPSDVEYLRERLLKMDLPA